MFRNEVLRNEWMILVLFGGTALVFYFILFYMDMWQKREKDKETGGYKTSYLSTWRGLPWSVKITIFLITVIMSTYAIVRIIHPMSW